MADPLDPLDELDPDFPARPPTNAKRSQSLIDKRNEQAIGGGSAITPMVKRGRGHPTKDMLIPWGEAEALYITTTFSTEKVAQEYNCSASAVRERSRKHDWVRKRKDHQNAVVEAAQQRSLKQQAITLADEVTNVGKLAHAVLGQLARKLTAPAYREVKCECGRVHRVDIPRADVSVSDLLGLIKVRSHLKGDPEFVVQVDVTAVPLEMARLSKDELQERIGEEIRKVEAITLE